MTGCLSDILDITGSNTFLAGCHACPRRDLLSGEIRLQRCHACVDQKQTVVVMRHQGKTLHYQMSLALEKVQEHLS